MIKKIQILFVLTLLLLSFISCQKEIIEIQVIEPIPTCFEGTVNPDWATIDIVDSFRVSYPPTVSSWDHIGLYSSVLQIIYHQPFLNMEIGSCDISGAQSFAYCRENLLYNPRDFISKNLPDSTVSENFTNNREVLKNILLFCKDDETVGVLYYKRYAQQSTGMAFVGKLYYTHPSDLDHFYFMGRLMGGLEGFERGLNILNSIQPIY